MKYLIFNSTGGIDSLTSSTRPLFRDDAIPITEEQYAMVVNEPWHYSVNLTTGELVKLTQDEVDEQAPKQSAAEVIVRLNQDFEAAMSGLQSGWPDYEVKTWTIQADEAKAWTNAPADDKPATPFLTQLYNGRVALGWVEPFEDLISRVITNNTMYVMATAGLIAMRHVAERNIEMADDPGTVTWSFSLQ